MPIYAIKNLTRYNHLPPWKPQHCPYTPNPIAYGKDNQATTPSGTSPLLDAAGKKCIQQIFGCFLYYACAVDPTFLMTLSAFAAQKSAPTEEILAHVNRFLDYMWMHPMQKSDIEHLTWSLTYTLMHPTSVPPGHKVMQEVTDFLVVFCKTLSQYSSMAQSISLASFSILLQHS